MGDERGSGELASGERAGSGFGGAPEQEVGDAQRGPTRFCRIAWQSALRGFPEISASAPKAVRGKPVLRCFRDIGLDNLAAD